MIRKKYKGFTLVELLAVILLLSLIFIMILFNFNGIFSGVNDKISKTEKKMILDAAKSYALEYRGEDTWVEEIDSDGNVNFCVSLESLIDYGYFKNDSSNYEKWKDKYVVEFQIVNGVSSHKFIKIEESDKCKLLDFDSNIENSDFNYEIKDEDKEYGTFNYKIGKINEKKYSFGYDLKLELESVAEEVYVSLILDTSMSMINNSHVDTPENSVIFNSAITAIKNFSENFIESFSENKAYISLIQFNNSAHLNRGFETSKLIGGTRSTNCQYDGNFFWPCKWGTNLAGGIDMAISLMCNNGLDIDPSDSSWCADINREKNNEIIGKNIKLYTIIFFDGYPNNASYFDYNGSRFDAETIFNNNDNKKVYYKNFMTTNLSSYGESEVTFERNIDSFIKPSISYLKDDLDVNVFMVGYNISGGVLDSMKKLSSNGEELCLNGKRLSDGKTYCYYESSIDNIDEQLTNVILNNIVNDVALSSVKFIIEPKKENGEELISLYGPNDELVNGNKLEFLYDNLNNYGKKLNDSINNYKFILNDVIYKSCPENNEECILSDKELFTVKMETTYKNGNKVDDNIDSPKFDLVLTKLKTIN